MTYQALARKWRPRTFDEVVGQQGVTQTLRNAIAGGRIGQAFIFAGARGVGKTTTARILAKALNCIAGPTVQPCGACDACVEIAEGRDVDVLEIDAATHTQVDKVREIVIEGLGIRPVRDRYKIFIIDEVHMLSNSSFNALLKSVEEPPPHVVFMMATTELHKIPDTIRSRSQEFEFRTIGTRAIAEQLRKIADAEGIDVEPAALHLVARSAEGSLRDAESALDQVIAFAGGRIAAADVATVLGLVARDLLLDIAETVADENAARVFDLAAETVERGLDHRLLCRELSRLARDLMVVGIDPDRLADPDLAPEGDLDRLKALASRFSREDLLRGFDILAKAEFEIRNSPQPRFHFEMALLKWIHARQAVSIGEVIDAVSSGRPIAAGTRRSSGAPAPAPAGSAVRRLPAEATGRPADAAVAAPAAPPPAPRENERRAGGVPSQGLAGNPAGQLAPPDRAQGPDADGPASETAGPAAPAAPPAVTPAQFRQAFLDELKRTRRHFHNSVAAQTQSLDLDGDTLRFTFAPSNRLLKEQVELSRPALEALARQILGRRVTVSATVGAPSAPRAEKRDAADEQKARLKERVLQEAAVQAMLDVFPAEIKDIEEIDENG